MNLYIYTILWLVLSLLTFFLYWFDKSKAQKGAYRIKESTLLLATFLLGSIGGMIGIYFLRHKSRHFRFILTTWLSFIVHCGIWYLILQNIT